MSDPALPSPVDLDDTSGCGEPGPRCECCGETGDITIVTATTPLGVVCLSMCPRCAAAEIAPPISGGTAARFAAQHAGHLGITVDDMAALLAADQDGRS